ncbi:MAG: bifunctional folylpolyglutamate synthase/dihydrofolate synthase [Pyrinomonadaceae bacterium]
MKLGLENIRKLLHALGDPQNNYLKVQVAGTNGKGSVCAFLDSICGESLINRGVCTSPHLVSITERIRINGADISEKDFSRHATQVRLVAENLLADGILEYMPTFFEQVTAIALFAFAEAEVDLAILETGLGGRLDATTAAGAGIAAITQIDIDHQEYLGEAIAQIAGEKAAIIHSGSKVVLGEQSPEVMKILLDRCLEVGAVPITGKTEAIEPTVLGLNGRHQIENANIAKALAQILNTSFPISEQHIADGLKNARHPGRLEFSGRYLFDGAHNAAGARALRGFLDESVTQPITLIFGAMKGKDVSEIANALFPKARHLILTRPANSRAMLPKEIVMLIQPNFNRENLSLTGTAAEAMAKANEKTSDDGIILVTGSLYLVGEVKKILNN